MSRWRLFLLRWLFPDYVTRCELDVGRIVAYQNGLAEGELRGRQLLALELEQMFSPDGRGAMTQEDARRVKLRQVH